MFESFDQVKINAVCPTCQYENRKTVRQLRDEPTFGCFACGSQISTADAQVRSALANIDQVRDELSRVVENRSIAVR
jgi:peptide subunit release factor 1 (eRF1)